MKRLYILSVGVPSASNTGPRPKKETPIYKKAKIIIMMILITKSISFHKIYNNLIILKYPITIRENSK